MKKWVCYGRRVVAFLVFAACMLWINEALRYLLTDDADSYTRLTMHEMYEQENIDVLLLGSSHSYRSLDPAILDEAWGMNTFNGGTSSQQPVAGYYLLKEIGKENNLSRVYMEVYYDLMSGNETWQSPTAAYIISDYMKPSFNRLMFLWDTGGKDYLMHGLVLGRRNWEMLFDFSYWKENLQKKSTADYRNYVYVSADNEEYAGKGFVYNREMIESGSFAATEAFSPVNHEAVSEENQKYLNKIIDYCRDNGIEVIFYSAPVPDFRLAGCENYDSYVEQMRSFLEKKGVPYYDFNLCRSDYLKMEDSCFKDDNHLNGEGAEIFTRTFARFFSEAEEEGVFWDSYEQKLEQERDAVFGVVCEMEKQEDGTVSAHIIPVKSTDRPLYFAVYKRREEETEYQEYRAYSPDPDFVLPAGENGYIHIVVSTNPDGAERTNEAVFHYG